MKSRRCTYLRLWVKKSALSSVDEMLLLSFELKETLGKIRPTYLYLKNVNYNKY